ncbi:MAG: type II toxin-antitoxin system RelE/ParE family toxin [Leptospiraceae bacterium]|nr:type II toxin-antitoxin system RelE/ParE family toxin [Leptospiraceae bacterium]
MKMLIKERFWLSIRDILIFLQEEAPEKFTEDFKKGIKEALDKIEQNPYHYSIEPQLATKTGLYRFLKYKKDWKIIFKVLENLLIILDIVHVKQDPKTIKKLRTKEK